MAELEHIMPLVTILLGLAIADLTMSLHRLLRAKKAVRWHWLPLMAATLVLLLILQYWWRVRNLPYMTEIWTYYWAFLFIIATLVTIFLLASAALPDHIPEGGLCLREYYFDNARYFWSVFVVFSMLVIVMQLVPVVHFVMKGAEVSASSVFFNLASNVNAILINGSLAIVRNRRYHFWVVPLVLVLSIVSWIGLRIV